MKMGHPATSPCARRTRSFRGGSEYRCRYRRSRPRCTTRTWWSTSSPSRPAWTRRRVLQVALQHADRGRRCIRPGGAHHEPPRQRNPPFRLRNRSRAHTIYRSQLRNEPGACATHWRVVHALGAWPTSEFSRPPSRHEWKRSKPYWRPIGSLPDFDKVPDVSTAMHMGRFEPSFARVMGPRLPRWDHPVFRCRGFVGCRFRIDPCRLAVMH